MLKVFKVCRSNANELSQSFWFIPIYYVLCLRNIKEKTILPENLCFLVV